MSRVECSRCQVSYDPRLTGRHCPLCDATELEASPRDAAGRDRLMTIVVLAAVANVLLLLALAVAVAHAA